MKLLARHWKLLAALIVMQPLAGCWTTMGTGGIDGGCRVFQPISWSQTDTAATIREVKTHNATHKAVCGVGNE